MHNTALPAKYSIKPVDILPIEQKFTACMAPNVMELSEMGILDNLRQQSENLKAKEQQEQQRQAELQAHFRDQLQPKMIEMYKYLNEFAEHLNYIKPDIQVDYQLNAEGLKVALKQENYKIQVDSVNETRLVNFRFECSNPRDLAFVAGDKLSIDKNIEYLQRFNLQYQCKRNKDEKLDVTNAQFTVKCVVPIVFMFKANVENSSIDLICNNFDGLGILRHAFKAHHFNETFFDNLGRFILRENPEFLKLNISEDAIEQIRAQIAEEQRQRQEELKHAEMIHQEEQSQQQLESTRFRLFKKAE
ncbi:MAG: hypothetical protein PVF82_08010 [Gammaproteobacteria bacterium]